MKIDAKITKTFPTGNVKAIADVTLDDSVAIHGVKLIDGKNGKFVSMPSDRWQDRDGNYKHTDTKKTKYGRRCRRKKKSDGCTKIRKNC